MPGENVEKEKDCISRCQEEFIECVAEDHADCVPDFTDCTGACER